MQKFTIDQMKKGSSIFVTLAGAISETSNFGKVDVEGANSLQVETEKVEYINSAGVQNWVLWIRSITQVNPKVQLSLNNVPYVLVKQVIGVSGFVPDNTKLQSLVVPYFCESCELSNTRVLKPGVDFTSELKPSVLEKKFCEVNCATCGNVMAIDASVNTYLKAIAKYCKVS